MGVEVLAVAGGVTAQEGQKLRQYLLNFYAYFTLGKNQNLVKIPVALVKFSN